MPLYLIIVLDLVHFILSVYDMIASIRISFTNIH